MTGGKEFRDLVSPGTARDAIDDLDLAAGAESVPLREARGRVLAERIDAALDVPGFDRASMDGYAVRARDTFDADEADPAVLDLTGTVHAGEKPEVSVTEGTAVEISTGAVMPEGADAVVMVERTDEIEASAKRRSADGTSDGSGRRVRIRTGVAPGDHVMLAGADIAAGERALGPGTRLTAREIGLLSALGIGSVPVRGRPRIGIVSTGDELVRPGDDLDSRAGQIYDVNSSAIATAAEEAGGEAVLYPHVGDEYDEMERVLTEATEECDLVLSSGSTSASAVDVIYRVIEDRGELLVHGVAIKPGKPMLVGRLENSAYVGLPGYPVSALMIFRTFVAPAIRRAAGLSDPETATVEGRMAVRERYDEGRERLMPVGLVDDGDGATLVYPVDKGSGATTSLVEADGIVAVDADTAYLAADETVSVTLFSPDVRPPTVVGVGEDDPLLSRLLDSLDRPRYLGVGSHEGTRRLARGVPDVAVASAPVDRDVDAVELGDWYREWGLVVPDGNPDGVDGVSDLVDRAIRFVNRGRDAGLRTTFENALDDLADDRGTARRDLVESIDGFDLAVNGHESPARSVATGGADAGLGPRATAERLDLGFVSLGEERLVVLGNPDRVEKEGVREFTAVLDDLDAVVETLPGYRTSR